MSPSESKDALAAPLDAAGDVQTGGVLAIFGRIAAQELSGRLTLTAAHTLRVGFKRGAPDHASTDDPQWSVGAFLIRKGAVAADDLQEAEFHRPNYGGDLLAALLAMGALEPTQSFSLLGEHARTLIDRAIGVSSGRYAWEAGAVSPQGSFALGDRWEILAGAVRRMDGPTVRTRLGDRLKRSPARKNSSRVTASDLKLTAVESRLVAGFDGTRSVEVLAGGSHGNDILRMALLFGELDLVRFGGSSAATAISSASATPASTSISTGSSPVRSVAQEINALAVAFAQQTHFEILGVDRKATTAQIKSAYLQLAKKFHPDTADPNSTDERVAKEQLFSRINDANRVLGDSAARQAYEAELDGHGAAAAQNALRAEEAFTKARILLKARKYDEALQGFDAAIALGEVGDYYAWRGYARFLAARGKKGDVLEAAMADLIKAQVISPRSVEARLFAGHMAKILGDQKGAADWYEKVLEIEPANADAKQELKSMGKR